MDKPDLDFYKNTKVEEGEYSDVFPIKKFLKEMEDQRPPIEYAKDMIRNVYLGVDPWVEEKE